MNALYTRDSTTEEPQDSPDSPTTLEDIIEEERTRLMVADAVLGCTSVAINNDQSADDHAFVYADNRAPGFGVPASVL